MDKGIRPATLRKFAELNVERRAGKLTNTQFRKNVMAFIMTEFGISLASAATHYNHALIDAKANRPTEVEGLGRPDDKKGGRKKKAVAAPAPTGNIIPAAPNALLQNFIKAGVVAGQPAAVITPAAAAVGIEHLVGEQQQEESGSEESSEEAPQGAETGLSVESAPELFTVVKAKDGSVVATGLTKEQAEQLIEKAKAAKKGALKLQETAAAE